MKKLIPILLLSMFFVEMVSAFHGGTGLVCDKCHLMHHSNDGSAPEPGEGPFEHLLTKEGSSELCLTCHDGQADTPDVMGEDDPNELTERSAGFFASADVENANGHNLQMSKIGPAELCSSCHSGGDFNTAKLGCIDCHDPHGKGADDPNYRYRNLQRASEPGSEPVFKAFVKPDVTGLAVYEQSNIGYTAPGAKTSDWREVTNICFDCHHTFKDDGYTRNSAGVCIRHPSTDSERGIWEAIDGHTDQEHWKSGTGTGFSIGRVPFIVSGATDYAEATTIAAQGNGITNEVFCLTCHKAHGSGYRSSLRWSPNSSLGCQQCHNKG